MKSTKWIAIGLMTLWLGGCAMGNDWNTRTTGNTGSPSTDDPYYPNTGGSN